MTDGPIVVGVIGGIASGKSAAADMLEQWGADRFDADRSGHEALEDPDIQRKLLHRWGHAIVDGQGRVVRAEIARRVFADTEEGREDLQFLNRTTHPWIHAAFERYRLQCRAAVLLVDAALLIEAGWDQCCDEVLFIDAPEEIRIARALERGWTEQQWKLREAAQLPLAEKQSHATRVIDNSGSLEHLRLQLKPIARLWTLHA